MGSFIFKQKLTGLGISVKKLSCWQKTNHIPEPYIKS